MTRVAPARRTEVQTLGRKTLVFEADVDLDARVAEVSDAQEGPVSVGQLRACGLSDSAIRRRHAGGRLQRLHRGVYVPGRAALSPRGWVGAGILACGNGTAAASFTAAVLRGLRSGWGSVVHVMAPAWAGRCHGHVHAHRGRLRPEDVTIVDGIPATSVARTLLDCAAVLPARQIEEMVKAADRLGTFDLAAVESLVRFVPGHGGRATLRSAVGLAANARGDTWSPIEGDLLGAFRALGLDEPECNVPVFLPGGDVVYPDYLWRHGALVVEADPRRTHDSTESYRSDRRRDRKLDAIGLHTMRFSDADLCDLAGCAGEVGDCLRRRRRMRLEFRPLGGRNSGLEAA